MNYLRYRKVPAYSFGGKAKVRIETSPGPMDYSPSNKHKYSPPSFKISTTKRMKDIRTSSPGVGTYDLFQYKPTSPSYKYGTMERTFNIAKRDISPSPIDYSVLDSLPSVLPSVQTHSFSKSFDKENPKSNLGPGSYKEKKFFGKESMKYSMGKTKRPEIMSKTPGPGQYTPVKKPVTVSFKYGRGIRELKFRETPSPGPGKYDSFYTPSAKVTYSFSKANKHSSQKVVTPGPGNYNIQSSIGREASITKSKINNKTQFSSLLYNDLPMFKQSKIKTSANAMSTAESSSKYVVSSKLPTPGPGAYTTNFSNKFNAPGFSFNKTVHKEKKQVHEVGPGNYRIPCSIVDVADHVRNNHKGFDPTYKFI